MRSRKAKPFGDSRKETWRQVSSAPKKLPKLGTEKEKLFGDRSSRADLSEPKENLLKLGILYRSERKTVW
jgi:hypothetical protein